MSSQEIFLRIRSLDLGSTGIPVSVQYGTGIPYDFGLILILILILTLNCSTVVLNCHKHLDDLLLRSVTQEGNRYTSARVEDLGRT